MESRRFRSPMCAQRLQEPSLQASRKSGVLGAGDMHPPMPGVRQCTSAAREVLLGVRQPGLRAAAATVAVPTKVLIRSAAGVAAQGSAPPAGVFRVTVRG